MPPASPRVRWIGSAIGVGAGYFLIGVILGAIADADTTIAGRNRWRLAAWIVSGLVFAAQIAYDRTRLRHSIGTASLHAATAAAVGGFLLAVAATIHKMNVGTVDARYLLALVLWPLAVAVPAFAAALVLSAIIRPRNGQIL